LDQIVITSNCIYGNYPIQWDGDNGILHILIEELMVEIVWKGLAYDISDDCRNRDQSFTGFL